MALPSVCRAVHEADWACHTALQIFNSKALGRLLRIDAEDNRLNNTRLNTSLQSITPRGFERLWYKAVVAGPSLGRTHDRSARQVLKYLSQLMIRESWALGCATKTSVLRLLTLEESDGHATLLVSGHPSC